MTIKGYLSDITFVELLKIIGKQNGRLVIWNFDEKKQYECFILDKSVIYLNFSGQVVSEIESAKKIFLELNADKKSYYAFQADSFSSSMNKPIISIGKLLNVLLVESAEADENLLPNLHTRFETVNKDEFVVDVEQAEFWKDSIQLLHKGCSASEICEQFGLPENTVRQNLYKLRMNGLIKPVRMFNAGNSFARSRAARQNLSRIAGNLNSAQQTASENAASPVMQGENASSSNDTMWQNAYENGSYPKQQQPFPQPTLKENSALSLEPENIPTPDFLIQDETPIVLTESKAGYNSPFAQAEPLAVQNSSLNNIQVPVGDAQTSSNQSVNIVTNTSNGFQKEENTDYNTAPVGRLGMLKRMLGSLFKN